MRQSAQYEVSLVLAAATRREDAIPLVLQAIGAALQWEIGTFWSVDRQENVLRWTATWYQPDITATDFETLSRSLTFAFGEGLPGQAWAQGEAIWLANILLEESQRDRSRLRSAVEAELRASLLFPVRGESGILGVIELFSRALLSPDTEILQTVTILGHQIGQFLERKLAEEALEARERQLASIVNSSNDAILGKTLEGIVTSWNPGAQWLYGYSPAEMIGQPISLLVPSERLEELAAVMERVKRGEFVQAFETVRVHKDGDRVDVSVSISPIRNAEGQVVGASTIARDITEYKRMQAAEANRALVLETANRVALDILASRTGVEALHHIAEAARTLVRAQYAALGVARSDGEGLAEFVTVGLEPEAEAAIGPRPRGLGVLGLILKCEQPIRIDSLGNHPASVGFPPNHPPMESFLGVPIRRGDMVLGSLYLTNKENGEPFTFADEVAVEALGAYAAIAIYNLQLLSRQRALVSSMIAAQEEERRAVAYDLHDGLTQFVMASHAHLEAFKRAYEADNKERAERQLDQGLRYLKEAVVESRRLVNGLRSLALDDLGLAGALEQLIAEEKARAGWQEVDFLHNIAGRRFDKTLETAAYRVVQEALTNARKHARTDRVRVQLIAEVEGGAGHRRLLLEVHDWGVGFVPEEKLAEEGRVGLHSMRERVSLLGGNYLLASAPEQGTTVQAVFPVREPKPEEVGSTQSDEG